MADLEELKSKYQSVLDLAKAKNVRLDHCHIQDDKLFIDGAAPNEDIKNEIWNEIKSVDASYGDLTGGLVEVRTRGLRDELHGYANLNILESSALLEGSIAPGLTLIDCGQRFVFAFEPPMPSGIR